MKLLKNILLTLSLALLVPAASAGTFSINAWTNDANSGIVAGQTLWAYHFGNTNTAVVNGVTVPGTGTNVNPSVAGQFSVVGVSFVFPSDANNLTALGGSGSAVMASSFIYGGAPWQFTVQGLTTGQVYTISIYGVGWDAPAARASNFTNGTDTIYVNENALGTDNGLRVDYTFTATATTNLTIVMPTNSSTFHTYALALRQPLMVTTNSNAGPGSLRQAVLDAVTLPGANPITFAPALSGATITLTNEIVLDSDVTIDASSLPAGVTVSGGNVTRIFYMSSGQTVSLRGLTLTGGNGVGGLFPGDGGAIENNGGTLTLTYCKLVGNSASGIGGALDNYQGTLTVMHCTLSGNSAAYGGAILSSSYFESDPIRTTLVNSTISGNAASVMGGGVYNDTGQTKITHATITGNTAPAGQGGGLASFGDNAALTIVTESIIAGNSGSDVDIVPGAVNSFDSLGHNLVGTGNALAAFNQSGDLTNAVPLLAPLGNYGGPTPTMPPLPGSPAIDAATSSTATTDQRGFARPVDGDHNGSAVADIGAVEVTQLWVTNNFNSGPGSLRQTIVAAPPFATVGFVPALSGQTITLSSQITITNSLLITASGLANGITVSGDNNSRVFLVNAGCIVTLDSLTLREGFVNFGAGGAILNSGKLTLHACTLSGNRSGYGGGIYTSTGGSVTLNACTLSGNEAQSNGGGIFISGGKITLNACTVSDNQASLYGGGIFIDLGDGTLFLDNTIIAGNTAFFSPDSANIDGTFSGTNNLTDGDPLLAPLGNFGGPTQTMPPLPGSPAINAAGATGFATDQRGYPRPVGLAADIGAVEVQNGMQNVIYDSLGFESPRFSLGTLVGQDGANGPWLQAGTGAATVQNTNVAAGAQAVRINRTGADVRFAVVKTKLNVGSSPTPIIAVEWSMKYQPASLPGGSFGPFFGMEVYDDTAGSKLLAASAGVDATTAELLYQSPGTGFINAVPGITVSPNTWHTYRLELDYSSQTYRLIYDGTEVLNSGFVDPGIADFTDADLMAVSAAGDPGSVNANGTAFFDNYRITALSVGSQILAIARAGAGQITLSWTPTTPGAILLETPSLSPANWTLSPSASTNPVTVPAVANKFYRLYRP